jgi:hypothetical protein
MRKNRVYYLVFDDEIDWEDITECADKFSTIQGAKDEGYQYMGYYSSFTIYTDNLVPIYSGSEYDHILERYGY